MKTQKKYVVLILRHPIRFLIRVLKGFRANQGVLLSGAVAYYTLLSIVPLFTLLLIGLSHLVDKQQLETIVSTNLELVVPGYSAALISEIDHFLAHREVVGTIFILLCSNQTYLEKVTETISTPIFGEAIGEEPESFEVNLEALINYFSIGFKNFGPVWANIIEKNDYEIIKKLAQSKSLKSFNLPTDVWVRIVYRYAHYFCRAEHQRFMILDTLIPLYNARVASLIKILKEKNQAEAEEYYDSQAQVFESMRGYLIELLHKNDVSPEIIIRK